MRQHVPQIFDLGKETESTASRPPNRLRKPCICSIRGRLRSRGHRRSLVTGESPAGTGELPARGLVVLEELAEDVLAGQEAGEEGIADARGAVHEGAEFARLILGDE